MEAMRYVPVDPPSTGTPKQPSKSVQISKADVAKTILDKMEKQNKVVWPCTKDFIQDALEAFEQQAEGAPAKQGRPPVNHGKPSFDRVSADLKALAQGKSEKVRKALEEVRLQLSHLIEQEQITAFLKEQDLLAILVQHTKKQFPNTDNEILLETVKEYLNE